jgi:hypothetical protein
LTSVQEIFLRVLANKWRPLRKINVEQHNVHTSTETCQAKETYLGKLVVQGEGKTCKGNLQRKTSSFVWSLRILCNKSVQHFFGKTRLTK